MKIEWKQCWKIGVSAFVLFLCITYWRGVTKFISVMVSALTPIIVGLIIAYLLNIVMKIYEKHYFSKGSRKMIVSKTKRPVCMILSILTMIGLVSILIYMIIPELLSCFNLLIKQVPDATKEFANIPYVKKIMPKDIMADLNSLDWKVYSEKIIGFFFSGISGAMNTVATMASSIFSIVVSGVVGFVFSIYFLIGKEKLQDQCKRIMKCCMKDSWYNKSLYYLNMTNECFHQYIVGKIIDAGVLGVMCAVGMMIFRLPYAVMIGALIGVTALIPVAGAYIGAGIGAIMILTDSPIKAILFIVFIIVLQQIEGNLIYPKIMSSSIGLPGIWVLAAVTIGGSLFGIIGMLIAVPIVAVIYRIVCEEVLKIEDKQLIKEEDKEEHSYKS